MSEWWTYRPSNFLMFSARTYGRLVELYNRDLWPLHIALVAVGIALLWLAATRPAERARIVAGVLAVASLWVAWAFHSQRHAQINFAAPYLAMACAAEAALLIAFGVWQSEPARAPHPVMRRAGWAVTGFALLLYPLLAPLTGREWHQAEVFGVMPDPTALATIGLLLATDRRYRGRLAVIPLLLLALGLGTRWLLGSD